MRSIYYILDGHNVIPVEHDVWGKWLGDHDKERIVCYDELGADIAISTVFIGLDRNWPRGGDPAIFETLVFRNGDGAECQHYSTWAQAEAGHAAMVARLLTNRNRETKDD